MASNEKEMMLPAEFQTTRYIDDGTGQFHEVILPNPPQKSKIANYNKPINKQKFEPEKIPSDIDDWTEEAQDEYRLYILQKRLDGHFFYNNGNIEYITGPHWYYLSFWELDPGLPLFNDSDRDDFYLWDKAWKDPLCYGTMEITNRRQGKTFRSLCKLYEVATRSYDARCGMQSKTGADAKEMFEKLVLSWKKLHWILKPTDSGDSDPKKSLEFREPSKRSTKGGKKIYKDVLNSWIDWKPSVETAYDGSRLKVYIDDEFGKGVECDVAKRWRISQQCLKVGRNIVGKSIHITTAEEMDAGGANAKIMWDESDMAEAIKSGRDYSVSGLMRRFKPGYVGLQGFIDEFGYSVIEDPAEPVMGQHGEMIDIGAKTYLLNERKGLRGDTLASLKRKFPFTIEEAFITDGALSPFDVIKLHDQHGFNCSLPKSKISIGNFKWTDDTKKKVEFQHNPNGKWKIAWMPPENERNTKVYEKGIYRPGNFRTITAGVDPFDHKITTDNRRSDGASYVFRKLDLMQPHASNMFVAEYRNRPPMPEIFYEDMAMQAVFYGTELLVENNKRGLIAWFENNGFYHYLMDRPDHTHSEWSKGKQREKGIPLSGDVPRQALLDEMESFIYRNVGKNDETGEMGRLYFNTLVTDLINLDPKKWTDYDSFVASSLALVATKKYSPTKKEVGGVEIFKTYNQRRTY